jgi:hypothetical protein
MEAAIREAVQERAEMQRLKILLQRAELEAYELRAALMV